MGQTRINSQDIRDQQVKTADIMDDAVTTLKILDANVTNQKLDITGVSAGTYRAATFVVNAQGRVTSAAEILTTKGDLLTFSTSVTRVGVGSDGSFLSADSTQSTGLKWLSFSATSPLSYNSSTGVISLGGLVSIGGANQILGVNASGTSLEYKTISGTTNQINVAHGTNLVTLSTPQDIHSGASPTYAALTLSGLTANRLVSTTTGGLLQTNVSLTTNGYIYADGSGSLASTAAPTNGQILIGSTGNPPALSVISGTSNRITITNGAGTITVDVSATYVGQNTITTLGTIGAGVWQGTIIGPTFGGTGLDSYTLGDTLYASATNVLSKLAGNTTTTRQFLRQVGTGTISAAPAWDTLVSGDIPNLDASKITTGIFPIDRGGTNSGAALNNNRIMISSGGAIVEHSALTTGSVIFAATATGLPAQDNANFFWDDTNNRLGILTSSPTSSLSIGSSSQFQVSSTGDLVKINNVTYSWPNSQGDVDTVLTNDGSGNLSWVSPSSQIVRSVFVDFLTGEITSHSALGDTIVTASGGTGVAETAAVDNTYSGAIVLGTGTQNNSTGRSSYSTSNGNNLFMAGGGGQTFEWRVMLPTLSTSSPRYIFRAGIQDSVVAGDPANGVYFYYTDNSNSGQWSGVTRNASTSTVVNSGIAVAAGTWYKLRFEINAAGTQVEFFVNDVSIGTSLTNIPTTNATRPVAKIEKGSSSNSTRTVKLDWLYYKIVR